MGSLSPKRSVAAGWSQYSRPGNTIAAADAIPILLDDVYNVFHLTTPPNTTHHPPRLRSTWSRLQSRDLIHWERDNEPSLSPGNSASDPDADGAWTGSAVIGPGGKLYIFYTGYNLAKNGKQVILRAVSTDANCSTLSSAEQIQIQEGSLSHFEDIDFRDPYVFYNEVCGEYWMLIGTRLSQGSYWSRGCIGLLTSSDLRSWTVAEEPLYSPNDMFCPECPELFPLPNGKWYLLYSRFHGPDAGTVYRVSDSPRGPFRVPRDGSHGRFDGRRWYAAKSCLKAGDPRRRVFFGWIGDYVDSERKWLWGGDLGLPREVYADDEGFLRLCLAPEILSALTSSSISLPVAPKMRLESTGSTKYQNPCIPQRLAGSSWCMRFAVSEYDAHAFGLLLPDNSITGGHVLRFCGVGRGRYSVVLSPRFPPLDDFWADQYQLYLPRSVDGPELVRHDGVSLDGGVLLMFRDRLMELFCGGISISFRLPKAVSPSDNAQNGISKFLASEIECFVEDGMVELSGLEVSQIQQDAARPGIVSSI